MTGIAFDSERINRYFRGELSDKDSSYIDEIFCNESKKDDLRHLLLKQFFELSSEDDGKNINLDHILYKIHYNINSRVPPKEVWSFDKILKWSLQIAGLIILPLIIFFGIQLYRESCSRNVAWIEIKAPAWTRVQFSLPDGTTGWLNSNSSVKYKGNFYADRQVTLKGEAFFDVVKDKKRPFKVNANEAILTVLGTRFNIASYENEKSIEVVLEEGELIFNDKEMNKSYTMHPNDLVVYDKPSRNFSKEVVQPQKYLSWTEGKLVFRNDPLDVIARRLGRWYNIDVEVNGFLSEDIRLRATFNNEGLEEVLNLLKRCMHIDYRIVNGDLEADGIYAKKKVIITLPTN